MNTNDFILVDLPQVFSADGDIAEIMADYFKENPVFQNNRITTKDVRKFLKRNMTYRTISCFIQLEKLLNEFLKDHYSKKRNAESGTQPLKPAQNRFTAQQYGCSFDYYNSVMSKLKYSTKGNMLRIEPPKNDETGLPMTIYEFFENDDRRFTDSLKNAFPEITQYFFYYENKPNPRIYTLRNEEIAEAKPIKIDFIEQSRPELYERNENKTQELINSIPF